MTLSSTSDLWIAELVIYLLLLPLAVYVGWLHGRRAFLGYFYLDLFCLVRIAADIDSLLPSNRNSTQPTLSTAILASIGLSPIMLALAGFIHETHLALVISRQSPQRTTTSKRWLWFAQIQIHTVAILGMVLVIIGTVKLVDLKPGEILTTSDVNTDDRLRSAGALLLLLLWIFLCQYAIYLLYLARKQQKVSAGHTAVMQLATWTIFALPFLGLRSVYTVAYTFDHKDTKLNPLEGALWVKVIFVVLAPLGAVICMMVAGWMSREIETAGASDKGQESENGTLREFSDTGATKTI